MGTVFTKNTATASSGTGVAISKSSSQALANRDMITNVNSDLVAVAANLGVTLIDTHQTAIKDANGFATMETTVDSVHPSAAFAHRLAVQINAALAPIYAGRPAEMMVPVGYRDTVTAGSFVVGRSYKIVTSGSPSLGTVGTVFTAASAGSGTGTAMQASPLWITPSNSPSQNTLPAGWATGGQPTTATFSATSDGWQRVRLVQAGTALGDNQLYIRVTSGFTAGDRVRFSCRIRQVTDGNPPFSANEFSAVGRIWTTAWQSFRAISGGSNLGLGDYYPVTGTFVSPIFTIPAGGQYVDAMMSFYNTDVTFDITQFGVFKVPIVENL